MEDRETILGHTCVGLRNAQRYSTNQCIPLIHDDGTIMGCDDWNRYCFMFCPYCGQPFDNTSREDNVRFIKDEDGVLRHRG